MSQQTVTWSKYFCYRIDELWYSHATKNLDYYSRAEWIRTSGWKMQIKSGGGEYYSTSYRKSVWVKLVDRKLKAILWMKKGQERGYLINEELLK